MKQTLCSLIMLLTAFCINSCSRSIDEAPIEMAQEDKSVYFLGKWTNLNPINGEEPGFITIERSEGRFLIHPKHFYLWDQETGHNGKVLHATYDVQRDKLIVSLGDKKTELAYNTKEKSLTNGTETLVPVKR